MKSKIMSSWNYISEDTMNSKESQPKRIKKTRRLLPYIFAITATFLLAQANIYAQAATDFQGSLTGVSITDTIGTNTPPIADFTYTQDGDTFTFDASASYDPDGNIVEYAWNFGDTITSKDTVTTYINTTEADFTATLIITDDGAGIAITQQIITIADPFDFSVSFQPADAPLQEGFSLDSGLAYNSSLGYGWTALPASTGTRDRNDTSSPDQSYDTMIHVASTGQWEIEIPNGEYTVSIIVGDAQYPNSTNYVQVEDVPFFTGETLSQQEKWLSVSKSVLISDTKLTIDFKNSSPYTKICLLKINNSQ